MSKYDSMTFWMNALANRSHNTRFNYRRHLIRFAQWMNKTPNELFDIQNEARRRDAEYDDPRDGHLVEQRVKAYIAYLQDEGYSISVQKLSFASIKSFFALNQVPLKLDGHERPAGDNDGGSRIPSKAEIRTIIEHAITPMGKPRIQYQALVLVLKDTGLRLSDVIQLTWSNATDLGNGFWQWQLLTNKRKVRGHPIAGPEATALLQKLPQIEDRIFPYAPNTIRVKMSRVTQVIDGVTAHGLRKFFSAQLQQKLPVPYIKKLMGKKTSAYDENRSQHLADAYIENYDLLRVFDKQAKQSEVDALQQEVAELRVQLKELQDSRSQTDNVMNHLVNDPEFLIMFRKKLSELS